MATVKRIHTLDGFRGIFALMIILDHANNGTFIFQNFLVRNSDYFVDYFFVLSGFVISYNYSNQIKSLNSFKDFMRKRIIRLYPLLFYTTLLFFAVILVGKHWNTFRDPYPVLFLQLMDTLTLMNSTPILGTSLGINYPSWSISSEMISYALFGFCIFAFKKRAAVLLSLLLAGAALFIISRGRYMFMGDFGFVRGLFCFIIGYFVYRLSEIIVTNKFSTFSELFFIFILLLTFKYLPIRYAIILPLIFAVGIFIFFNGKGIVTYFLETRPIQFLGKISFSVYLNHAIVVLIIKKLFFDLLKLDSSNIWNNIIYLFATIFLTIIYSHFTNKYIETGIGNLLRQKLYKKTQKTSYITAQTKQH